MTKLPATQNKRIHFKRNSRVSFPPSTLATLTPCNLCHFLVYKDKHGRTQVQSNSCSFMGQRGKHPCGWRMGNGEWGAPKRGIGEGLIAVFWRVLSLERETDGEGALVNHYSHTLFQMSINGSVMK